MLITVAVEPHLPLVCSRLVHVRLLARDVAIDRRAVGGCGGRRGLRIANQERAGRTDLAEQLRAELVLARLLRGVEADLVGDLDDVVVVPVGVDVDRGRLDQLDRRVERWWLLERLPQRDRLCRLAIGLHRVWPGVVDADVERCLLRIAALVEAKPEQVVAERHVKRGRQTASGILLLGLTRCGCTHRRAAGDRDRRCPACTAAVLLELRRECVGLDLRGFRRVAVALGGSVGRPAMRLGLRGVRDLVREERAAVGSLRVELALAHVDVAADGDRARAVRFRGRVPALPGMKRDVVERRSRGRLELATDRIRKLLRRITRAPEQLQHRRAVGRCARATAAPGVRSARLRRRRPRVT